MTLKALNILSAYKEYWILWTDDIKYLTKKWIVNWIWPKEYKLNWLFKAIIKLPFFDNEKGLKLVDDVNTLSIYHDVDYTVWWNYINFTTANLRFVNWLSDLLNWTSILKRYTIILITFIALQWKWTKYFNFK